MSEYQKIPNIYLLDKQTSRYNGQFSTPELEYLANCRWECTEKIDGTNIRILWDGYRVTLCGRTDRAALPESVSTMLNERFGGSVNETFFEQIFGATPANLYGEAFGPGIHSGGKYGSTVQFRIFDVLIGDFWLESANVKDIAEKLGTQYVPEVFSGTLFEAVSFTAEMKQTQIEGGHAIPEGLVCRPAVRLNTAKGKRILCKIRKEFL